MTLEECNGNWNYMYEFRIGENWYPCNVIKANNDQVRIFTRNCIYNYLKGEQMEKDAIVDYVSKALDVKKNEVSKVITAMKKEKIIYVVEEFGWLGID